MLNRIHERLYSHGDQVSVGDVVCNLVTIERPGPTLDNEDVFSVLPGDICTVLYNGFKSDDYSRGIIIMTSSGVIITGFCFSGWKVMR
jgi:hypothetical protein